jgi:Calx-beta domain
MKRSLAPAVALLMVSVVVSVSSAASNTVVRPGALHGWIPFDPGSNGRWVTGPGTVPLGSGSAHLKDSTLDVLEYDYSTPSADLATFVATFEARGSAPPMFGILTDADVGAGNYQDLFLEQAGSAGWNLYDATAATGWTWDCNGDGSLEGGPGSIADFGSDCNGSAKVAAIALISNGADTWVDDVALGATGSTTTYDMEPPVVSAHDKSKTEGDSGKSTMSFKVTLSGLNDDPVYVHFVTANGTAVAGKDYIARKGTLKILPGTRSGVIKIAVIGDTKHEPNETFKLKLSSPTNGTFGRRVAIGTIVADD